MKRIALLLALLASPALAETFTVEIKDPSGIAWAREHAALKLEIEIKDAIKDAQAADFTKLDAMRKK